MFLAEYVYINKRVVHHASFWLFLASAFRRRFFMT